MRIKTQQWLVFYWKSNKFRNKFFAACFNMSKHFSLECPLKKNRKVWWRQRQAWLNWVSPHKTTSNSNYCTSQASRMTNTHTYTCTTTLHAPRACHISTNSPFSMSTQRYLEQSLAVMDYKSHTMSLLFTHSDTILSNCPEWSAAPPASFHKHPLIFPLFNPACSQLRGAIRQPCPVGSGHKTVRWGRRARASAPSPPQDRDTAPSICCLSTELEGGRKDVCVGVFQRSTRGNVCLHVRA